MFAHACKIGLEGVVSKVRNSHYPTRRGRDWVKKTCAQRETLTIAGFALDGGDWSGIYLGRRKGNKLIYAGEVDHGFDKKSSAELRERLHSPDPQIHGMETEGAKSATYQAAYRSCMRRKGF